MAVDLLKDKVTDDQLKAVSMEDLGRAVQGLADMVKKDKAEAEAGGKTRNESMVEFEKRLQEINVTVEKLRTSLPPTDAPLRQHQGDYLGRKGGLFKKGAPTLEPLEVLSISPSHSMVRGEDQELIKDFQDAWDATVFKCALETGRYYNAPDMLARAVDKTVHGPDYKRMVDCLGHMGFDAEKAVQPTNWTPPGEYAKALVKEKIIHPESGGIVNPLTFTVVSAQVVDLVRLQLSVANEFVPIPLSHTNQKIPCNRGDAIGVRGGAASTDPPPTADFTVLVPNAALFGTIAFGTADFDVEDVLAFLWWQDRAVIESAVPLVPYLRDMIAFAHARAIDRACMSGSELYRTQAAQFDDFGGTFNIRDARALWNGLRYTGDNYKNDIAGTYDSQDLLNQRRRMGVYGFPPNLVAWMNIGPLYDIMNDAEVATVNTFGPQATVKTGTLAEAWGCRLKLTEWIPTDQSATTGYSASGGTKTSVVMAMANRYALGSLGVVGIETTRWAPMKTTIIQAGGYYDMVPFEALSSGKFASGGVYPVDIAFNIPS